MSISSPFGPLEPAPGETSILVVDDLAEKLLVFETLLEDLNQNLVFARSGRSVGFWPYTTPAGATARAINSVLYPPPAPISSTFMPGRAPVNASNLRGSRRLSVCRSASVRSGAAMIAV